MSTVKTKGHELSNKMR